MRILLISLFFSSLFAAEPLRTLFNTLDPTSLSKALAFYELYPDCDEGSRALIRATSLLHAEKAGDVLSLTALVNRTKGSRELLSASECAVIERLAAHFPNRALKGYRAESEEEVLALPSEEIDLGRALLLSQLAGQEEASMQARSYSALLDLMALQIATKLPDGATAIEKIKAMNTFIFDEMHFRFPPQSIYAEAIDLFTFLPSVMDDHLGVCLGVTALYLSLAQRLALPLDIITPPGHIFVRYTDGERVVNIETTARGIHMPSETYLGINTRKLEKRALKEVIGMTHVNQASVYLHSEQFEKAAAAYERAEPYMKGDALVCELLGYSYLLIGDEEKGRELLERVRDHTPDYAVKKRVLAEDYLLGHTDCAGIRAVFLQVDEKRSSILRKQEQLQAVLKVHPTFRDGWLQSAICYMQLGRAKEALVQLKRYHELDPTDPAVEYYLAVLQGERHDFQACWKHLKNAEALAQERDYMPKVLRALRTELLYHCPE